MSQSITDRIKGLVSDAVDAHAQGDDFSWDVGSGMGPNNQLFHFLTFVGKSPVLGETIQAGAMIADGFQVTGETVAALTQQAFEHIRAERTKKLTQELPANNHFQLQTP